MTGLVNYKISKVYLLWDKQNAIVALFCQGEPCFFDVFRNVVPTLDDLLAHLA